MTTIKSLRVQPFRLPNLIRQIIIGWVLAVTIEYSILPKELRTLAELTGLAQMSMLRLAAITCCTAAILFGLSARFDTDRKSVV